MSSPSALQRLGVSPAVSTLTMAVTRLFVFIKDVCVIISTAIFTVISMILPRLQQVQGKFSTWLADLFRKKKTPLSINDVIDRFSNQLGELKELTTNRNGPLPKDLLEKASNGLVLKGVLVTNNTTACINLCKTVIKNPSDVVLRSPISSQKDHVVEFTSKAEADHFCRSLETMGHSIANSVKGGQFGFQMEEGLSVHEGDELTTEGEPYLARVLYSYVPTAACELDLKKLLFDERTLEQLKEIDELLLESGNELLIQNKSECFLKDYGSHINVGNVEFGGIYQLQATISGKTSNVENSQGVVVDDLGRPLSMDSSGAGANITGRSSIEDGVTANAALAHSWQRDGTEPSKVAMNVTKKGGPQEATSLSMWKEGLVKYNDTWAVIDRGSSFTKDFVGIWEIVTNNQRKFSDARKLADSLHRTWQLMNGIVPRSLSQLDAKETPSSLTKKVSRETILNQLGLGDYYPSKITLQNVIAVQKRTSDLTNLPWLILQKLIMLEYKCRENELSKAGTLNEAHASVGGEEDIMFEDFMKTITSDMPCESKLNPLDVFLAIYACCDMILKQTVLQKMFLCRLAVPFISPHQLEGDSLEYSLWAMRSIIVDWKNEDGILKKTSVVCQPIKSVAFLQLGETLYSKSALLNNVISDEAHHTFWNRESPLGESEIQLADGLVEAQWYLPTGKSDDLFDNVTLFLNLRGNASEHKKQVNLLQKMSNVVVCCLSTANLEDPEVQETMKRIHDSTATVVLLLSTKGVNKQVLKKQLDGYFSSVGDHHKTTTKLVSSIRRNKPRTKEDLKQELRQILQESLLCQTGKSLQDASKEAKEAGIQIDEDNDFCKRAKELAAQVMTCMGNKPMNTCKMEMLPLQSQEWSGLLKAAQSAEGTAAGSSSIHAMAKIEEKKNNLQGDKLEACNKLSSFVEIFLRHLVELTDSPAALLYLQWLKIHFDERCRNTLPDLHHMRYVKWKEMEDFKTGLETDEKVQKTENKVDSMTKEVAAMEKRLGEASLGVEHLLREVGEVYAAAHNTKNKSLKQLLDKLPEVAAKLLLKGEPIELMDGDAPNVPLTWVKAVFSSLTNIVGEKTLFVISVLGIQGSGKSTMLNTMFGLQFPVSAGRCTRGAYMQLLKVDKTMSNLPYDYVLVVDTEGFHAAELGELKRENDKQLATFVVGLGDVTILNTKGENVSEMSDVLNIAVQSFIRMKFSDNNFRSHRTCCFIRQNVPDINAKIQLEQGSQALQEQLDKITVEVCASEKINDVQTFGNIIKFDSETDVWYFPDLWHGDPPMAPANPRYTAKVQEVRNYLLYDLPQKGGTFLTFSDLSLQVEDLWKGVLSEDFVFHFQNSLVAKSYHSLERTYQEKLWNVRNSITEWLTQIANVKLEQCTTKEEMDTQCSQLMTHLIKLGSDEKEKACAEFEQYFESHNLKDILIRWKPEKTKSLRNELTSFLEESKETLGHQNKNAKEKVQQKNEDAVNEHQIMKMVKDFANERKGQTVDSWEKVFDDFWNTKCILGVKPFSPTIRPAAYKMFMNIINQNSQEIIAADLLVDHMEELVKQTVRKGMTDKVANEMVHFFGFQKYNLLIWILKDLAEGGFDDYKSFIKESKLFGLKWITSFTNKKIFDDNGKAGSEYIILARKRVENLVQAIQDCIEATTEVITKQTDPDIKMWVTKFCATIEKLPITESDLKPMIDHNVKDLRNLQILLIDRLSDMKEKVIKVFLADKPGRIEWDGTPPYQQILDRLWGCEGQCPFCKEVCQRTESNHLSPNDSHQCIQHRPVGVAGVFTTSTKELTVESCNFKVQSGKTFYCSACKSACKKYGKCTKENDLHPYKEYRKFLPDWNIAPSANMESSKYWMWFMAKYKNDLAEWHKAKIPGQLPEAWNQITKQEAVDSLRVYCTT